MSKIDDLADRLRELLVGGEFPDGSRFPSEYELQERFSVSRVTANKAVALLVAEGLLIRGKRGSGTFVKQHEIFPRGWIAALENFNHPYNIGMIAGAAQEAFANGCMLSVFKPENDGVGGLIKKLQMSDCMGILVAAYKLEMLPADCSKPVIYLDGGIDPEEEKAVNSVMCDNYGAAFEMMERIISSGRKEIVFLGIDRCLNRKRRMQGFYDAMLKHGMKDAEKRKFVMHHGSRHENRIMLQKILRKFPDVDFIATDSDDVVYNIMQIWGAERENWRMKTGISGFGNIHGISDLHKIPTIEQHPWHIGSEAVKVLLELAANGKPSQPVKIQVPAELVNAEFI